MPKTHILSCKPDYVFLQRVDFVTIGGDLVQALGVKPLHPASLLIHCLFLLNIDLLSSSDILSLHLPLLDFKLLDTSSDLFGPFVRDHTLDSSLVDQKQLDKVLAHIFCLVIVKVLLLEPSHNSLPPLL